jgi:hypothetical protein
MITIEERLKLYNDAIEYYKNNNSYSGFCMYFKSKGIDDLESLPELYEQRPNESYNNLTNYWWSAYNDNARVYALEAAIKLIYTKYKTYIVDTIDSGTGDHIFIKSNNRDLLISKKALFDAGFVEALKDIPKELSYKDIADSFFKGKRTYYIDSNGGIDTFIPSTDNKGVNFSNNGTHKQLEGLLALNKLQNVARYLNQDHVFDWNDSNENKWFIKYSNDDDRLGINFIFYNMQTSTPYFKTKELAKQAIQILGEEEVIKAITWSY